MNGGEGGQLPRFKLCLWDRGMGELGQRTMGMGGPGTVTPFEAAGPQYRKQTAHMPAEQLLCRFCLQVCAAKHGRQRAQLRLGLRGHR